MFLLCFVNCVNDVNSATVLLLISSSKQLLGNTFELKRQDNFYKFMSVFL